MRLLKKRAEYELYADVILVSLVCTISTRQGFPPV